MSFRLGQWLSLTHLIILAGILVVLRITWLSVENMLHASTDLDISSQPSDYGKYFKSMNCGDDNKSCAVAQPDDVYLGRGLYAHKGKFYLDGEPFRIFSGSFHYFRTHPSQWTDRLLKIKAAGLNTVMTYIPWNLHEPVKGQYDFSGDRDIASFVKQAQKVGLKVIVRPGPYICSEWDLGGLPAWLLSDPAMKLRVSHEPYLRHIEEYFAKLFYILAPLAYKKGGPIIAFQVENEYGSYADDKAYLRFLVDQFQKWSIEELLFTSDGVKNKFLERGTLEGVLATINCKENQQAGFNWLKRFQPDKPLMVTEFWSGWFDHWGEHHHTTKDTLFEKYVTNILKEGASLNFYIFVGGTNFGFWNGANTDYEGRKYAPVITSYDYDAPISEHGALTAKFYITQRLLSQFVLDMDQLPDVKTLLSNTSRSYGSLKIEKWLSYKSVTDTVGDFTLAHYGRRTTHEQPVSMERLNLNNGCGQNFGWLLYRTQLEPSSKARSLTISGHIHDYALFIVDHQQINVSYRNTNTSQIMLPPSYPGQTKSQLDILVENMGRVNYKTLEDQHKGILGTIYIDGDIQRSWTHIPLEFDEEFISTIIQHENWQMYQDLPNDKESYSVPGLFRATLNLDDPPGDTFLDMKGWTKGIVIVNNFVIGRYWRVGPQRTLYIPAPLLLEGINTIIVFELHKPASVLNFVNGPYLDHSW